MAPTATGSNPTIGTSAAAAATTSTATQPGSLEEATQRYQAIKLALRTGLANKRIIDRALIDLESQIYLFEGSYLQSTASSGGNIVKGFDSYLKNSSASAGSARGNNSNNNAAAALGDIPLEDRIFSLSSATYQKSLELKANEGGVDDDSSANNTPKGSRTTEVDATPVGGKKKKDTAVSAATPTGKEVKKKKDESAAKHKDKERSSTPNLKGTGGGKNTEAGSAAATPTKGAGGAGGGGKAGAGGTATKLKRKLTDGGVSGTGTPSGKAQKRKKDDD
ncbi:uncharacterized protein SPSC_00920 [Sporisorium scitamineum]|uniref:Chromatin modification-related protein EAF6 n=1 Tax=Sporisorium scitamineum TaxID=49012 RepID=A0A0F7RYL1_9BASI|nr:hypothetical protein [Sporisorium scitamineum]CDU22290.1 uncharacterized protein SPSC_00920 [Sporisorium scitamineum]